MRPPAPAIIQRMTASIDGDHYLLLRTRLWADTPDVEGIYASAERALADARESARRAGEFEPARWRIEGWRGAQRLSRLAVELDVERVDATRSAQNVDRRPLPMIGTPAIRALRKAGISTLDDLEEVGLDHLATLHGVGPKALQLLKTALRTTPKSTRP